MTKRWLGLSASKENVIYVDVEVPDDDGPIVVLADDNWKIQNGDRGEAYSFLHQQCADYIRENNIDGGNGGAKLCHGSGVMVALRAE